MKSALQWVTYRGDIEWFKFSARSYKKFARGWSWNKCIVPHQDFEIFRPVCEENGIFLQGGDEWPEAGFNWHQSRQCMADLHFPDADVIFHIDSDTVFASECSPEDWLPGGKILLPFTDFSRLLTRPVEPNEVANFMGCSGLKLDFNRGQYYWKFACDFTLGWSVERETMQWMPLAYHREVYPKLREVVAARFPAQGFEGYVRNCRNEWPQGFCEFNSLGAIAHRFFEEKYHWSDVILQGYPFAGKVIQCWTKGGFDKPYAFAREVGGYQTPRQLFHRLGL